MCVCVCVCVCVSLKRTCPPDLIQGICCGCRCIPATRDNVGIRIKKQILQKLLWEEWEGGGGDEYEWVFTITHLFQNMEQVWAVR